MVSGLSRRVGDVGRSNCRARAAGSCGGRFRRSRPCCAPTLTGDRISSGRASGMRRFCGRSRRPSPRTRTTANGGVRLRGWSLSSSLAGPMKPCVSAGRKTSCFAFRSCGARSTSAAPALLIGDREVIENHGDRDSGSRPLRARRWPSIASPQVDYGVAYRARIKMARRGRQQGRVSTARARSRGQPLPQPSSQRRHRYRQGRGAGRHQGGRAMKRLRLETLQSGHLASQWRR